MRIAVISDSVFPTPTPDGHGLGRVTSIVAEGLLARGHDVVLFAKIGSRFSGALVMPNDAVVGQYYDGERALAREALKLHLEFPFDCFLDNSHLHYLSRMLPTLPVVSVFHDVYQEYRRCPILLSEGQRAVMPTPFENARIIHNALNPADFEPLLLESDPPYALMLGLSDIKQPLLAIEATARIGMKLVIAGQSMLGKFPITPASNVEYVGPVSGAYKAELYRRARVVLNLGISESFGLTTLEAGLYGCPVVGWPVGGTLDLIEYGKSGVFVVMAGKDKVQNVADAIERAQYVRRTDCRAVAESLCKPEEQIDAYEAALAACARGEGWG